MRGSDSAHVTGAQQQQMELEEEALINKMAKRLSQLLREKQQLANAVEAEEEHISNTLQRRLAVVHAALSCCPRHTACFQWTVAAALALALALALLRRTGHDRPLRGALSGERILRCS